MGTRSGSGGKWYAVQLGTVAHLNREQKPVCFRKPERRVEAQGRIDRRDHFWSRWFSSLVAETQKSDGLVCG